MADERLGIEIAASATGTEAVEARMRALRDQLEAFRAALSQTSNTQFAAPLIAQIRGIEAELNRLSSSTISQYANVESFNIRAIAAMRGQADAIRGVAREMGELDRITRSGTGRVAYGAVDPAALRIASAPTAASHKAMQAELDAAFGATAASAERAAGRVGSTSTAIAGIGRSSNVAGREVGHLSALFDELAAGRHRQAIATIGASIRDAGLGTAGLVAGLGGLVAIGAVAGFERMVASAGELAEKTLNAATSAGVAVEKFTELRTVMAIQSGDTGSLPRALGLLQSHAEEALGNPFSGAAAGFANLGIGPQALTEALRDPISLLEKLREEYQRLGPAASEAMRLALGRAGFQELASYLRLTDSEMQQLSSRASATGEVVDEKFLSALAKAGVGAHELGQALEGLRDHAAALAGESGLTSWLTKQVEILSHAADGWRMYFNYVERANSGIVAPTFTGGEDMLGGGAGMSGGSGILPFAGGYSDKVRQAAAQYGVPPELLARVIGSESDFNPNVGRSSAGATGIAQFLPSTAKQYGFDPSDPDASISGAAHYLSDLHRQRGSWTGALTGYLGDDPNKDSSYTKHGAAQLAGQLDQGQTVASTSLPPPIPSSSDLYQPEQARRNLELATKQIEDERRIKDSEYQLKIDQAKQAGKNDQEIAGIEQEKANYDKQQAQKVMQLHKDAADVADKAGAQPGVGQTFREGATGAQVEANQAQGAAVNAQTAANQQAYQQQREIQMNSVEDAKTSAEQILNSARSTAQEKIAAEEQVRSKTEASYASIIAMAKQYGQQSIEVTRQERAEKQAVLEIDNKIAQIRRQGVSDAMSQAASGGEILQSQRTTLQAQIETMTTLARVPGRGGSGGSASGADAIIKAYQSDAALAQSIATTEIATYQKIAQSADATASEKEKAEAKIAEISAKTAQEQAQDFEKAYQAWQKAHEGMTEFFNSLGSGFQTFSNSLVKALFSPQVDIIHAGLTTIKTNERGQEIRQAIGQMLLHGVQSAVDGIESAVSKVLGNMLSKALEVPAGSLGDVFGSWITKMISGAAPNAASFGINAASTTTLTTAGTTLVTAGAGLTAAATALTTAAAALTAGGAAAGAGGLSGVGALATGGLLAFSSGGIIPSAAGGMVVGGLGAQLILGHPEEMMLPAHISNGLQRMISGGGGRGSYSPSINYSPQIQSGKGGMSRSEFSGMLASHKDDLVGIMRNDYRRGWRP